MLESPHCDLCGSYEADTLFTGRDWSAEVPDAVALVRCRHCGLVYLCPRPVPEAIGAFYPPDYAPFRTAVEDERRTVMRWMRRRKLARRRTLVERYAGRRRGRVLDVGCSTGLFLHEMALGGWAAQGVELTPSAVCYARERFGLTVFEGMLEDAPLTAGSFDAVTYWDVLEHVYSPMATLARTAELLRPGGIVAINVPNWDAFDRRLFGRHWQGYDPPRHLYVFNRATLGALLDRAGFEVLDWVCFMPSYFTFILSVERWLNANRPGWTARVMRVLNFPGARLLAEPPFWLANRLGRGSVIAVFARKR
jgi:SAM-dependent methyltransferase